MIYFLLRAGSYRVLQHIGQRRLQGVPSSASPGASVPCTPTHTHPCTVPTHKCMHTHVCSSTRALALSIPHAMQWDTTGCGVGRRQGHLSLPLQSPGHPTHVRPPADHIARASPVSRAQTLFSVGWGAADLCQMTSGSSKRGWRPWSVGLAHTVLSPAPQNQLPPPFHILPQPLPAHVSPNTDRLRQGPQCPKDPHTPCPAHAK